MRNTATVPRSHLDRIFETMTPYQRTFGTGPRGLLLGLLSLSIVYWLNGYWNLSPLHGSRHFSVISLTGGTLLTAAIVVWSLVALPPSRRGRALVTAGPFRYVRHPLYAAFLIGFNLGLAIFMDGWLFLAWAALQYPLWHLNIAGEECLLREQFGSSYKDYCQTTGRFLPRLGRARSL